jgi:asparagine synthase (glutamine-hydrolysing)
MYQRVTKLLPGRWLDRRADGTVTEHVFWDLAEEMAERHVTSFDVEHLRDLLKEAVRAHMVADVPIGAFLSGGLDSSLVVMLAREHVSSMDCFTVAFRAKDQKYEAMPDDLTYARQVANAADVKLHEIIIEPDIAMMLPQMIEILDEPIGEAAAINTYLICKRARHLGIKVLLSGMGADEVFAGYRRHVACMLATRYRRLPALIRAGLVEPLIDIFPAASKNRGYRTIRWAKRFLKFANLNEEEAFLRSYALFGRDELHDLLYRDDLSAQIERVFSHHSTIYAQGPKTDQVNRMCRVDIRLSLPGLQLALTDRASMAASVEVRLPFVDIEVVRAALRLRGVDKIRGRESKFALKKAAEAWLTSSIIYRPKGLFSAPLRAWVRNDLKEMVDDILTDGELVRRGYVRGDYVRHLIDDDRKGRADYSKEIWHLLTMDHWLRKQRRTTGTEILRTFSQGNSTGSGLE